MNPIFYKLVNLVLKTKNGLHSRFRTAWLNKTLPGFNSQGPVAFGRQVRIRVTDGGHLHIGKNVTLEDNAIIHVQKGTVTIGDDVFIGHGSEVVAKLSIVIGSNSLIAPYVVIRDANHQTQRNLLIRQQGFDTSPVLIGEDCWIGAHATVTAGSHLADGAVVGANAVVTGKIHEYSIAAGVPARVFAKRS
jgi:acetyltransferase-like isoleucine patch superfamily enzyme